MVEVNSEDGLKPIEEVYSVVESNAGDVCVELWSNAPGDVEVLSVIGRQATPPVPGTFS